MNKPRFQKRTLFLFAYLLFALLPIYWMLNMSFKTNEEIVSSFSLWPQDFTLANYITIFTDESWYSGYINSLIYVGINVVIVVCVALPAAYAFSRYRFLGDKHVFFWLLTNRMTPPAVFFVAILSALQHVWTDGYPHCRCPCALAFQRALSGLDFRRFYVGNSARNR